MRFLGQIPAGLPGSGESFGDIFRGQAMETRYDRHSLDNWRCGLGRKKVAEFSESSVRLGQLLRLICIAVNCSITFAACACSQVLATTTSEFHAEDAP